MSSLVACDPEDGQAARWLHVVTAARRYPGCAVVERYRSRRGQLRGARVFGPGFIVAALVGGLLANGLEGGPPLWRIRTT